jgi:hypothetical protein
MGLINLGTYGGEALQLISQFLTQPSVAGVTIQSTRFESTMEAEVSKHVLIDLTQGKHIVNDNVAPGPRSWSIEGYIGGSTAEVSSRFMPSLLVSRAILENAFLARQLVTLRDPSARNFQVVIQSFWYSTQPEVANRVPVKLALQEVLSLSVQLLTTVAQAGMPIDGTAYGAALPSGNTETNLLSDVEKTVLGGQLVGQLLW